MPPRWSRVPTRDDPEFRRLDDRMTFATHVAAFTAINSGMWFFQLLQHADWAWLKPTTGLWVIALAAHALYIFAIAKYDLPNDPADS
jgi:hypothetical protein